MKLKRIWKIFIGLILLLVIIIFSILGFYNYNLQSVDKSDDTSVVFTITPGTSTKQIAKNLMDASLIRNDKVLLVYLKLNNISNMQASTYKLRRNMSLEEIVEVINKGKGYNPDEISITFKEGENIRNIAKVISENTENSYEDVLNKVNDNKYLDSLIEQYWFLDKNIKSNKLYYSLEGFLAPDTYIFENKNVKVEEIFSKMLDETDKVLTKYKKEIEKSDLSIYEILTLASIVEKEGKTKDFNNIASVFINRLDKNMELGSCATAYYGVKKDFNEVGIATTDMINNKNNYNTYIIKGLSVGPIASISEEALLSVINPISTNYLYFLSDNEGNTYFFKTYMEHQKKQAELKSLGKWAR